MKVPSENVRREFIRMRSAALLECLRIPYTPHGQPRTLKQDNIIITGLSEEQAHELADLSEGWSLSDIEQFITNLQCRILGTERFELTSSLLVDRSLDVSSRILCGSLY